MTGEYSVAREYLHALAFQIERAVGENYDIGHVITMALALDCALSQQNPQLWQDIREDLANLIAGFAEKKEEGLTDWALGHVVGAIVAHLEFEPTPAEKARG